MSKTVNCPICGKTPRVELYPESRECCGVWCEFEDLWNKYATAMALAVAISNEDSAENKMIDGNFDDFERADRDLADLGVAIDEAYKTVVETFNG